MANSPDAKPSADIELLEAWKSGSRTAGDQLLARHMPSVQRFFANKVVAPDDAVELVSQTFLACTAGLQDIRAPRGFRAYLFGVVQNVLRNYYRKQSKRKLEEEDFDTVCVHAVGHKSLSSTVMGNRRYQAFVDALRDLPINDQIALEYRYFMGHSAQHISELIGVPAGTMRRRLLRARERLREKVLIRLHAAVGTAREPSFEDLEAWSQEIRGEFAKMYPEAVTK